MSQALRIVITGASAGIGREAARALAADGHRVFACARRADRMLALADSDANIEARTCDVANEEQVRAFVAWLAERTDRIDALINAAGHYGAIGSFEETDTEEWLSAWQSNLAGTYLMSKHLLPLIGKAADGRIINFAGGGAFDPLPRYSAYAVSKAAVVRLSETMAAELRPRGIAVNAIAPGFVATEIHEATLAAGPERAGTELYEMTRKKMRDGAVPVDVPVNCVRFLLSDAAKGLTGKTLSASFDPWGTPEFADSIDALNESALYTMRRVNLADLPDEDLARRLADAAARKRGKG